MSASTKTYNLPSEVAAALMTGRPELLVPLITELKEERRMLNGVRTAAIVELLKDVLTDLQAAREEIESLKKTKMAMLLRIVSAVETLNGNDQALEEVAAGLDANDDRQPYEVLQEFRKSIFSE